MLRQLVNSNLLTSNQHLARRLLRLKVSAADSRAPKFSDLSVEQRHQIDNYLDILLDWNTRMNLTAITDRDLCYQRHIDDSLALLPALDECVRSLPCYPSSDSDNQTQSIRVIDVGSGAGLPGIVLAIARPRWHVTLLDSLQKRCSFNSEAILAAGICNASVVWARAEEAGREPLLRETHDIAVARAVAELRVLAELCLPLVAVGGFWIAAKGSTPQEETLQANSAIKQLGGEVVHVKQVDSVGPEGRHRTVVVTRKREATPARYPRKPGTPKKQPL